MALLKLIFLEEMTGQEEDILSDWIKGGMNGEVRISAKIRERRDKLRELGYKHFREVYMVGGRRSGKGYMTAIATAKKLAEAHMLGDPGSFYGIAKNKEIYFTCVAGSLEQAQKFQFSDIRDVCGSCKLLAPFIPALNEESFTVTTANDDLRIKELTRQGIKVNANFASLRVKPLAAQAGTLRGSASLAQPLTAQVMTINGWTTMGELKVGDLITGSDGKAQLVLQIHPRGLQETYRVNFSDGSSATTSGDHLWTFHSRRNVERTLSTLELRNYIESQPPAKRMGHGLHLPPSPVIEFGQDPFLPIDPYLLGALLGDGSMMAGTPTLAGAEDDFVAVVAPTLPEDFVLSHYGGIGYGIVKARKGTRPNGVMDALKELGVAGKTARDKFIPELYLYSQPKDRLALLSGLLDTDGSVLGTSVRFGTVSEQLAEGVCELVRSLGGYVTTYFNRGTTGYEVCISGLDAVALFRFARKRGRAGSYSRYTRRRRRPISVEALGYQTAMQCITVSNDDGLYITDDFIITHNCLIFDEVAHMIGTEGKSSAEEVYKAALPATKQFGSDAIVFLNSSPYSMGGQFYECVQNSFELDDKGNPKYMTIMSIQFPSWEMFRGYELDKRKRFHSKGAVIVSPDWPEEMLLTKADKAKQYEEKLEEMKDPDTYRVEARAQWAATVEAFLNPVFVDRAFAPKYHNKDIKTAQNASYMFKYWMHQDPASTTDGFGMAMGHVEDLPYSEEALAINPALENQMCKHVVFDVIWRWEPKDFPNRTIDYERVQVETMDWVKVFYPYSITFDQFNGAALSQWLQREVRNAGMSSMVSMLHHTQRQNLQMWHNFRQALNLNLVHMPFDSKYSDWANLELKFLEDKGSRVDHQSTGPVRTSDVATAIAVVTDKLLGSYIQNWSAMQLGETHAAFGSQGGYRIGGSDDSMPQHRSVENLRSLYGRKYTGDNVARSMSPRRR